MTNEKTQAAADKIKDEKRRAAAAVISLKDEKLQAAAAVIRLIAKNSKSPFLTRAEVPIVTGGLIAAGTLANLDSLGEGIPGAFRIKRQICYPVDNLCDWLIARLEA